MMCGVCVSLWSWVCSLRDLESGLQVRPITAAQLLQSWLSGPTERRASLSVIKLGKIQARLGVSCLVLKKKKIYWKFHLKFPSIRLFSLNVSAGSSISFFSFSFRMICLRAISSHQDVLDSSKDVVVFFSSICYKYRISVVSGVQLHSLLSSGRLAQQFRLH